MDEKFLKTEKEMAFDSHNINQFVSQAEKKQENLIGHR